MPGKLSITVGLPGSGKTTAAYQIQEASPESTVLVSRDGLRKELFNGEGILSGSQENYISKVQKQIVKDSLRAGKHVVVHDMNLRERYRNDWAKTAYNMGAEFNLIDFTGVDVFLCQTRNLARTRRVPPAVINKLYRDFIKPLKGRPVNYPEQTLSAPVTAEPYVWVRGLPSAIIVDVDGTVADGAGVRDMYDPTKYHLDKPRTEIIQMVREAHYELGKEIIFCSGRHIDFFAVTEEWLYREVKVPFTLVMREHEGRDDSVEKLWLFDNYIRGKWNIDYVLDDRDRVVKAWRSIGLTCLQVEEGDF